jgi:hypothetical protein
MCAAVPDQNDREQNDQRRAHETCPVVSYVDFCRGSDRPGSHSIYYFVSGSIPLIDVTQSGWSGKK